LCSPRVLQKKFRKKSSAEKVRAKMSGPKSSAQKKGRDLEAAPCYREFVSIYLEHQIGRGECNTENRNILCVVAASWEELGGLGGLTRFWAGGAALRSQTEKRVPRCARNDRLARRRRTSPTFTHGPLGGRWYGLMCCPSSIRGSGSLSFP